MKNFVMLSALAGVLGLALPSVSAEAAPRRVCKIEKRVTWVHGHKRVKVVRVCRTVHHHGHHYR